MGAKLSQPETTSTRQVETVTGSHEFKVEGYSFDKELASGVSLTSAIFTVGGYDWAIMYYPNGSREEDKDNLAFLLKLQSEAYNVKATLEFSLLNHSKKLSEMKAASTKTFICKESKIKPVIVPPSDLDQQLHHLVKSGEGADVTFEVGGEFFKAHKLILGVRSRVFHAQFFGQMKEKWAECIKLDNIEAEVFRVFLHFIYSDSLSKLEETIDAGDIQNKMIMYQHLLVAADRPLPSFGANPGGRTGSIPSITSPLSFLPEYSLLEFSAAFSSFSP
ncbi:hypothetical protein LUZ60_005239 [Juncus effusus]|nr:hypothetical protein LUZ60_005239 [Juncus effusus]